MLCPWTDYLLVQTRERTGFNILRHSYTPSLGLRNGTSRPSLLQIPSPSAVAPSPGKTAFHAPGSFQLKITAVRVRREFGAPVAFTDRNSGDSKDGFLECTPYTDKTYNLTKIELDKGIQVRRQKHRVFS